MDIFNKGEITIEIDEKPKCKEFSLDPKIQSEIDERMDQLKEEEELFLRDN